MRLISLLALVCALSACASSPPPPPKCEGEFRPLNIEQKGVAALNRADSLALCSWGNSNGKA